MKVLMPQLGETVHEGTVSAWHKKAGDEVIKDEILLDVETDKVATEIPAPVSGLLASIAVAEEETVEVGTVLAVIDEHHDQRDMDKKGEVGEQSLMEAVTGPHAAPPNPPRLARAANRLSPVVRRLLAEHRLDVRQIDGTGHGGRITRNDVRAVVETLSGTRVASQDRSGSEPGPEIIPFNRIRKATADHMVRSKATSPHVLQTIEVDFSKVDLVRLPRSEEWKSEHGFSLTYLPFVAHAVCRALSEYPQVNARVVEQGLRISNSINLSIAVDLDLAGLVAPVVRDADRLKVSEFSTRTNELVQKARAGQLEADDLADGTYTLSNPGAFGTLFTAPIINQPQVAILSTDAVIRKPVVVNGRDGETIAIRPVGVLAQSFDHRAFDGAYSAAYLNRLKSIIEQDDWADFF
ncbi:dihydrolipoamide acetyltransferase family protein [Pseudomonadota bacterium]